MRLERRLAVPGLAAMLADAAGEALPRARRPTVHWSGDAGAEWATAMRQWALGQPAHRGAERSFAARLGLGGVPATEMRFVARYPIAPGRACPAALVRIIDLQHRHVGLEILLLQDRRIFERRLAGRVSGGFTVLRPAGSRLTVAPTLMLAADAPGYGVVSAVTPDNLAAHWLPPSGTRELTIVCDAVTEAAAWAAADRLQAAGPYDMAIQRRLPDGSRVWLADGASADGPVAELGPLSWPAESRLAEALA
jgi:hypothetical protein